MSPPTINAERVDAQRNEVQSRSRTSWVLLMVGVLLSTLLATTPSVASAQTSRHADVDRLYCAYFLRQPDSGGQAYWHEQRDRNLSLESIAELFADSAEFRGTYGQQVSNADFVQLIYRNLFDRQPDPAGFEYWVGLLDRGELQRGYTMVYFSESGEFKQRVAQIGCGNTGGGSNPAGNTDPGVASRLAGMGIWATPTKVSSDGRSLTAVSSAPQERAGTRTVTACQPQGLPVISRAFDELPAFAFSGPTLPGLVVEGSGIAEGDLRVLPLERSSIKLVSDADSANPVRSLVDPTTSTLQSAVSDLKRDADARLTGIDVIASDITYTKQETHSFEESSLNVGVSLHYESETIEAGFKTDFEQTGAVERHSISVRLVEPMFTIRMERDGFANPQDYFGVDVTQAQIDALIAQGKLSPQNPPVLIESVTYGRIMAFTMTSESAESAQELMIAVNGAYSGLSGEGNLTERQKSLLESSSTQMMSYGGNRGLALAAIKSGDLSQFFGAANTTTAAPLTMEARTLTGAKVDVADEATLKKIVCTDQFRPYQFLLKVSGLRDGTAYVSVNGSEVRRRHSSEGTVRGSNHVYYEVPDSILNPGTNTVWFEFDSNGGCVNPFGEVERMDVSVSRRSEPTDPWELRWFDGFDKVVCFTSWTIEIDPITGRVTNT